MADGSISDMSDADPGNWFWPSPALPVGAPWYTDMPEGSVVLRVLSQRGGQATATPARIDDAALDPDRTARLAAVTPQISVLEVWRGGGHARSYISWRVEGDANAVYGEMGCNSTRMYVWGTQNSIATRPRAEEVKSSGRKSA